jgi:hypothetical protein
MDLATEGTAHTNAGGNPSKSSICNANNTKHLYMLSGARPAQSVVYIHIIWLLLVAGKR